MKYILIIWLSTGSITVPLEQGNCDFFMQEPFFKNKKFKKTLVNLKKVINCSKNVGVKYIVLPLVDFSSI